MADLSPPLDRPVALVEDRYGGVYSGGSWLAIAEATAIDDHNQISRIAFVLSRGPHGDDLEAAEFWQNPSLWIALGDTPDEALAKLPATSI